MTAYIPLGDWCERLSKRLSDGLSDGLSEGELDMLLLLDFQHDVVQNRGTDSPAAARHPLDCFVPRSDWGKFLQNSCICLRSV